MTYRLRWSAWALRQLEEALGYVAADDARAAQRLGRRIEERLGQLKALSMSGRVVPELDDAERREVIVSPFRIVYRVHVAEVRVLAVVHGRRLVEDALPDD